MQPQRYFSTPSDIQLGLETLTICPKKNQSEKHCNSCMIASSVVSSSASSLIGDYIGMESCFDLDRTDKGLEFCLSKASVTTTTSDDGDISGVCSKISRGNYDNNKPDQQQRCRRTKKREFPPPIPSLARTENLFSHMPWVLKRYYTSDGRLILREEKVKNHEYFRAHRSNGRLTLHLVPLDDDYGDYDDDENDNLGLIEDHHEIDQEEEDDDETTEEEAQDNVFDSNIANADDDNDVEDNNSGIIEDPMIKCSSAAENPSSIENGIAAAAAANAGTFLNYSSVRASPTCFLGLPVPAIRPVHS